RMRVEVTCLCQEGDCLLSQAPRRALLHVVPVQPIELVKVKDRWALDNVIERKLLGELGCTEDFRFPVRRRPAKKSQIVHQGLRQDSHLAAEARERGRTVPLREGLS